MARSAARRLGFTMAAGLLVVAAGGLAAAEDAVLSWTQQFGTVDDDLVSSVAVAADGTITVAGTTTGDLEGTNAGGNDGFVRRYDTNGNVIWTRQFGTASSDRAHSVAVAADGTITVAGDTYGDLEGTNASSSDGFVRRYDTNGNMIWTRQFGTTTYDSVSSVAVAADGTITVAGDTYGGLGGTPAGGVDGFVRRYDTNGNVIWTRQFGTSTFDTVSSVAVAADGTIAVAGATQGNLQGTPAGFIDGFVRRYDSSGNVIWTRQFSAPGEEVFVSSVAVAADGAIIVAGDTSGDLEGTNAGSVDGFVRRYDTNGNVIWTRQFGTPSSDSAYSVAVAADGAIAVAGDTSGDLEGTNAGSVDGFVRRYDTNGNVIWTGQFGTPVFDSVSSLAVAADGAIAVAGDTEGDLEGTNAGSSDGFVRRYVVPVVPPGAPTAVTGVPGDEAVTVYWSPPTRSGGDPNLSYVVTGTPGGTCTTTTTSCQVTGLTNGTAYTFTITATNSAGSGPASAPSTAVVSGSLVDCTVPLTHPFTDVSATSFARHDVGCIYALNVTTGTSPTTYSPADNVTREQMAAFLARLYRTITGQPCTGGTTPFTDVSATSFAKHDIGCIYTLDITTGTSPTTYSPADNVTREQMAAFLARLYRTITGQPCTGGTTPFTDVSATSFAKHDIGCIYTLDITTGTSPTTYSPADNVTREQMAAFLARLYRTITGQPPPDNHR